MKRIVLLIAAIVAFFAVDAKPKADAELDLRIGTYNVWAHYARAGLVRKGKADAARSWDKSKAAVADLIVKLDCDFIGMQEVSGVCRDDLAKLVKKSGGKIIAGKGATFYGIAASVTQIVNSIYSSAYTILPVSTVLEGEYGISDVALSTLCAIGSEGVVTTLTPKLSDEEMEKMRNSAEVLKGVIAQIEI